MKKMLEGYIAACEKLIAEHMLIGDADERHRAVTAQTLMKADFEKILKEL